MNITVADKTFTINITESGGKYCAALDNELIDVTPEFDKYGQLSAIKIDDKRYEIRITKEKDNYKVAIFQTPFIATIDQCKVETEHIAKTEHKEMLIRAPMSGLVLKMNLAVGQVVEKDSHLLVLEAMKMQNEIKSPIKAKVQQVFIKVGQTVEKDDKLLSLEPI